MLVAVVWLSVNPPKRLNASTSKRLLVVGCNSEHGAAKNDERVLEIRFAKSLILYRKSLHLPMSLFFRLQKFTEFKN
jgi:hypothetical protein